MAARFGGKESAMVSFFWGAGYLMVESQLADVPRTGFVFDYATSWAGDLCGIDVFNHPNGQQTV